LNSYRNFLQNIEPFFEGFGAIKILQKEIQHKNGGEVVIPLDLNPARNGG
jgi:hypothetical protein